MNIVRAILCTTALLTTATFAHAGSSAETRQNTSVSVNAKDDGPERITQRQQPASGKNYVLSTNGWSEMTLNDNTVYMQLTERGLKEIGKPEEAHPKAEGFLESVIKAAALSGVKQMLDHSIALSLQDTRSALVRNGEVVFVTCRGKEIFNSVKFNDQVQKYPQDSAEAFVANVNRQRAKLPACRT